MSSDADVSAENSSLVAVDVDSPLAVPSPVIVTLEVLSTEPSLPVEEELVVVTVVVLPSPSVVVEVEVEKLVDVPPLEVLVLVILELVVLLELLVLVLVVLVELVLVLEPLQLQLLQPPQWPACAADAPNSNAASAADANSFFMVYLSTPFKVYPF